MQAIWQDLMTPGISVTEKLIRTVLVYLFLIIGLRLAGKRELSQINPFDLVVLLLLSNTVQNAIIGNDNSLIGGVIGAGALLILNGLVVRGLYHYGKLDAIEGKPDLLVRKGRLMRHHLERELITVSELEAAARRQGIGSLAHVQECRLETGGSFSFVAKTPTDDDIRHHELVGMLAQMEVRQSRAVEQIAALERKIDGLAHA
jgi:uncharacterized membrane protein YcaP (DUF421 family)